MDLNRELYLKSLYKNAMLNHNFDLADDIKIKYNNIIRDEKENEDHERNLKMDIGNFNMFSQYNNLREENENLKRQINIDYEINRQRSAGSEELHKNPPRIVYLRKKKVKKVKSNRKSVKKCSCKKK